MTTAAASVVGVVGLGLMGRPVVHRLAQTGLEVLATTRSAGIRRRVAEDDRTGRVQVLTSPADLGRTLTRRGGHVVLTALPASAEVREVCFGSDGLLSGQPARLLVVDLSTCSPDDTRDLARDLADRGATLIDAPVSGGPTAAAGGTLSIMAGATTEALAAARNVLGRLGTVVHCGTSGAGQVTKACNQMLVTAGLAAVAEALLVAEAAGVDPGTARAALLGGYASSRVLELHGDRMVRRDFAPGGRARLHAKDCAIARQVRGTMPTPTFDAAAALIDELAAVDHEADHAAVYTVLRRAAGLDRTETVPPETP